MYKFKKKKILKYEYFFVFDIFCFACHVAGKDIWQPARVGADINTKSNLLHSFFNHYVDDTGKSLLEPIPISIRKVF